MNAIEIIAASTAGHAFRRYRTTTGSETTMKALGPNDSLNMPPCSKNLSTSPTVCCATCLSNSCAQES